MEKIATLEEIRNVWTLNDLGDAHEMLDIKGETSSYYHEEMDRKQRLEAQERRR